MGKLEDMTGQKYGKWTVIGLAPKAPTNRLTRWYCVCECGTEAIVYSQNLKRGGTQHGSYDCGCGRKELLKHRKYATTHGQTGTPEYRMWAAAKARAKKKGLPFNIELSDISIPAVCPVSGLELKPGKTKVGANSPTLDRIIPDKGYVKGNVAVISHRANGIKQDASIEEVERMLAYMKAAINGEIIKR